MEQASLYSKFTRVKFDRNHKRFKNKYPYLSATYSFI